MGYTHYWEHDEISEANWLKLVGRVKNLFAQSPVPLAGWDGNGEPVATGTEIRFNGAVPEDYETFWLTRERIDFAFCKTEFRPYDLIVTSVLLIAHRSVPHFKIRSDGVWDAWLDARDFIKDHGDCPWPARS